jgi:hypothetical protein
MSIEEWGDRDVDLPLTTAQLDQVAADIAARLRERGPTMPNWLLHHAIADMLAALGDDEAPSTNARPIEPEPLSSEDRPAGPMTVNVTVVVHAHTALEVKGIMAEIKKAANLRYGRPS